MYELNEKPYNRRTDSSYPHNQLYRLRRSNGIKDRHPTQDGILTKRKPITEENVLEILHQLEVEWPAWALRDDPKLHPDTNKNTVPSTETRIYRTNGTYGCGGTFVQTGDFVSAAGMGANSAMTLYCQEKVEYNAKICLMNMAVHGLHGIIKSGSEANTFYYDAHNLDGCCDYVMANPPFNVDKVNSKSAQSAGRLPFGMPTVNKAKEVGNANYLWISYFYSFLNEHGRAGFVMVSSAIDSSSKDRGIWQKLVETGHLDVMVSVGNNFFYIKSLPCSLWFFGKGKRSELRVKVLFIDARNYYTVVDRTLNERSNQLKNLNAIVWLYQVETGKYMALLEEYCSAPGMRPFAERMEQLSEEITALRAEARKAMEGAKKKTKRSMTGGLLCWRRRLPQPRRPSGFTKNLARVPMPMC